MAPTGLSLSQLVKFSPDVTHGSFLDCINSGLIGGRARKDDAVMDLSGEVRRNLASGPPQSLMAPISLLFSSTLLLSFFHRP